MANESLRVRAYGSRMEKGQSYLWVYLSLWYTLGPVGCFALIPLCGAST